MWGSHIEKKVLARARAKWGQQIIGRIEKRIRKLESDPTNSDCAPIERVQDGYLIMFEKKYVILYLILKPINTIYVFGLYRL